MASADSAPPARARNARGEGDRLREQLLVAAVTLIEAEGDAGRVSVRAIAKAAGVSPTALYLHFPDREALVSAAVDRGFAAFNAAILGAAASTEDPEVRLRRMGLAYLDFVEAQPALYGVIFSVRRATASVASGGTPVNRAEALDALVDAVAALRPGAPRTEARELALTLWAALHGFGLLRARPPVGGWPAPARYVEQLMRAHVGATGEPPATDAP